MHEQGFFKKKTYTPRTANGWPLSDDMSLTYHMTLDCGLHRGTSSDVEQVDGKSRWTARCGKSRSTVKCGKSRSTARQGLAWTWHCVNQSDTWADTAHSCLWCFIAENWDFGHTLFCMLKSQTDQTTWITMVTIYIVNYLLSQNW